MSPITNSHPQNRLSLSQQYNKYAGYMYVVMQNRCNHYVGHLNLIRIVIIIHQVNSLLPVHAIALARERHGHAFNVHFYCHFIPITRISHSFDWHNWASSIDDTGQDRTQIQESECEMPANNELELLSAF